MKIAVIVPVVLLAANVAVAQIQTCSVVSPAKEAQFEKLGIPVFSAMTEYMTAIELINAESKAFHCEFPPREMIRELEDSIAWRVTRFAQAQGPAYNRMFIEYVASSGQNTVTATVAIKWLKHNNLIAKFNVWDAAEVRRSFEEKRKQAREEAALKSQQANPRVSPDQPAQSAAVAPTAPNLAQSIGFGDVRFSFPVDWVKTQTSSQTDTTPDKTELRPQPQNARWLGYGVNFSFMHVQSGIDTSEVDVGAVLGTVFRAATNSRAGMKALGEQVRFSMKGYPAAMQAYQDTTAQSGEFGVMIALMTPHGMAFWRTFSPLPQKDVEMALVKSLLNSVKVE